jgi:hypothetical protein
MARTTAQLEGWIVRDTTAGVPAGGEPEANGPNGRRATETGDRERSVVSSISLTTQRVIRFLVSWSWFPRHLF